MLHKYGMLHVLVVFQLFSYCNQNQDERQRTKLIGKVAWSRTPAQPPFLFNTLTSTELIYLLPDDDDSIAKPNTTESEFP